MRGHVRKRCQKWAVVVDIGRGEDGKRIQKWHSGYYRRKDAERALAEILGRLEAGAYVEPSKLTLGDYLTGEWLPAIRRSLRPGTFTSYDGNMRRHVIRKLGHVRLRDLSAPMLTRFYGELLDGDDDHGALSPRTVRYIHAVLRHALADAVKWDRLVRNVADSAEPPSAKAAKAPQMQTWTADQLRRFLAHAGDHRLAAAWRLAATTGMRRGEVLGLRWRDLDLDTARASIQQTMIAGVKGPELSTPKTASGERNVALDAVTVTELRAHRKRQAAERLALGAAYQDADLVFCREDGVPLYPQSFSRTFERLTVAAKLPVIRFHDLRHTHATLALAAGVHAKVVSERLGHANIGVTLDTYSHAIPAMQEDAAAKVAALLEGS